jgi:hypothetical protein
LPPESIYLVGRRLSAFVRQSTRVRQLGRNLGRRLGAFTAADVNGPVEFFLLNVEWRTEPAIKDIFVGIILRIAISSCCENN